MTTWKDGGPYGAMFHKVTNEDGNRDIATVWTRQSGYGHGDEPWPEGEANFRLILQAPKMLEALEKIEALAQRLSLVVHPTPLDWRVVRNCARAAIAAVKGENDDNIS